MAGLVAIIVSVGTLLIQQRVDDGRSQRELIAANLAYVREKSSFDRDLPRPFNGINLRGQNLSGLHLQGGQFQGADLSGADLSSTDLSGADLYGTDLSGANLRGAILRSANLPAADFSGADLSFADLVDAIIPTMQSPPDFDSKVLEGEGVESATKFDEICANTFTTWSTDLTPPASSDVTCERFK